MFKLALLATAFLAVTPALADPAPLTSDRPAHFQPKTDSFDYVRREVMVPMRDGVKLHTVILVPKGAKRAGILLTRTPYDADTQTSAATIARLAGALDDYDNADDVIVQEGYIRVIQDVRGKYHSEGDYVMNPPPKGPLNPAGINDATDAHDTIEWLSKNIPESNGNVGIIGISYDGFTSLMALIEPSPALKVAVPMNPMVDGWVGDDWYHRGAFRQLGSINYIYEQEGTASNDVKWWTDHYDDYDAFMEAGPGDALARMHDTEQLGFYRKIRQHPAYDDFWQPQALDKVLAAQKLTVPTLLVHSLFDQEDIYGAMAVYKALKASGNDNGNLYLAFGPWHHGQGIGDGSAAGDIRFSSDTALTFRMGILRPFLAHFLQDNPPRMVTRPVSAFETGTNRWQALPAWPAGCLPVVHCSINKKPLYLRPDATVDFTANSAGGPDYVSYVSDPAKPIPFIPRPIHLLADGETDTWKNWLTSDQRNVSTRTDVLTFEGPRLTKPMKLAGEPVANLIASTTGTDGDFVVKLIDVYPDVVTQRPEMGGFQLMISADILRGRYRNDYAKPEAIPAGEKQTYRFALPNVNHMFLLGHRIMVQVQSTWFPLYDRNPQTFVPNIFDAKAEDYRAATIKLYGDSFVELPVVQ
jgi:uncharacterized protein